MVDSPWLYFPNMVPISSYYSPVDIPVAGPLDAPLRCASINDDWLKYVAGALSQLRLPVAWRYTTNAQLDAVMGNVDLLIAAIGTAGWCMQSGTVSLTILAGSATQDAHVTFPNAFSSTADVVVSESTGLYIASSSSPSSSGVDVAITSNVPLLANGTALLTWFARSS
jgi:hypothetical protein